MAVLARIDPGAGLARAVAQAATHVPIDRPFRHRVFERERHAFLPRHIDPAALAGLRALVKRGEHRDRAVDARCQHRLLALYSERLAVDIAAERQQPAGCEQCQVGCLISGIGSVAAERRYRHQHETRVALADELKVDVVGGGRGRSLDHRVAACRQFREQLTAGRGHEIERDAALAGIEKGVRKAQRRAGRAGLARGNAAQRRAFRRLDAHDIGPKIGQEPPRIGGVIRREIENADSRQRGRAGWRLYHQSAPSNLSRNASQRFINRSWRL
jgi:hypothetical protein